MSDTVDLLVSQPSSNDGVLVASFSFPFPVDFLADAEIHRSLRMHTLGGFGSMAEADVLGYGDSKNRLKEEMRGLKNRSILSGGGS